VQAHSEKKLQVATEKQEDVPDTSDTADGQSVSTEVSMAQGEKKPQNISFEISDLLDVYVDAKDSVNNWCVAKITDLDLANNRISIHFEGWSARYDEVSNC